MALVYTINFRPAGNGAFAPLDAAGLTPFYSEVKWATKPRVQVEDCYNSEAPMIRSLGNRSREISFKSLTQHASSAAAIAYLIAQEAAVPDLVDLQIIVGAETITFLGCALTGFTPDEPTGISNTIHYSFVSNNASATP